MADLRSPFPYYGNKRRAAPLVWAALGDCDQFIEPFCGSAAILLARPKEHRRRLEIVNDACAFIPNFLRAVAADPPGVARYCNSAITEPDLMARHLWLVNTGRERLARLEIDPDYYDLKAAGWWCWGLNSWMGSGWCSGGPWVIRSGVVVDARVDFKGTKKRYVRDPAGVTKQRPHLGWGQGTNRVSLSGEQRAENLLAYLQELADRLAEVRICCGDWSRVVGNGGNGVHGVYSIGMILDPPFDPKLRTPHIYASDSPHISRDVRKWALEHGDDPKRRIVLCGFAQENASKMPKKWRMVPCPNGKRYGIKAAVNLNKECLWFSPHCLESR